MMSLSLNAPKTLKVLTCKESDKALFLGAELLSEAYMAGR